MVLSIALSVLLVVVVMTISTARRAAPVDLPCSAAGRRCVPGMCCSPLKCLLPFGSRTGICSKPIEPVCTPAGGRCLSGQCCPSLSCLPVSGSRTGICGKKPLACAPIGERCRVRTPYYTGPSFPCCDSKAECFYANPMGVSGVCRQKIIGPPCLPPGTTCTTGDATCCPSLACTAVITGVYPPGGVSPRVCFDENCSTSVCSASTPCCPGYGCAGGMCLAPPAPPPGGI